MNISSTPFIRNDYWPDYNELNELNGRIDEVENELSLTNIFLNDRIENVENNLNTYIAGQNNTVTTNNIVVNNINANYAAGDYLNFNNINADNIYVENLIVNKPAFNVVLNTPHIENVTSLGGNIFNANIIDCEINTDNIFVNNLNVAQGTAETFKVTGDLIINKNIEPVTSSAVLGYDPTGKVIPVRATYDVSFPEDANYLYTDHFGTAYAGTAETEVTASDNLITANAVYNEALNITGNIDNLRNDMNNEFNIVNDNFANIDNNFNDIANNFSDVANNFNDVNNFVNDGFNDVNNFVNDGFNNTNNLVNDLQNIINDQQNIINDLTYKGAGYYNQWSPVNFSNIVAINYKGGKPNRQTDYLISTPMTKPRQQVFISFNSANNTLVYSYDEPTRLGTYSFFNKDMSGFFWGCRNFNVNIELAFKSSWDGDENYITNMFQTFHGCRKLDQNILIPDTVTDMTGCFAGCTNLNQNILIPNSVININQCFGNIPMSPTWLGCTNLNQNILIPNSVTLMNGCFANCTNLDQNILIPNSVIDINQCFTGCTSLSQDIYIYSQNITRMNNTFTDTQVGNIHIPTSVPKDTSNYMYNCLVNGYAGITFPAANIFNDLPVDIEQWPPL